ncbi:type II toxin-antitoxin system prevent-host-death family antitoxin [Mycobacterium sp. Lab-001]|uniref:type II toxin-antitoxin system prevent-host-death family antitoxin n=1 Tax=Mycobacterium sp. Lab-001 TaxID=3410136 RepID=UPI003D16B94E
MSETVGIRELRHNTADIISAAAAGQAFHVTVRGRDTGVIITRQPPPPPPERRRGVTLAQIEQAGLYNRQTTAGYQAAMLEMIERGRDDAGRVGDQDR